MRRNQQQLGAAFLTALYGGTGGLAQAGTTAALSCRIVIQHANQLLQGGGVPAVLAHGCSGAETSEAKALSAGLLARGC